MKFAVSLLLVCVVLANAGAPKGTTKGKPNLFNGGFKQGGDYQNGGFQQGGDSQNGEFQQGGDYQNGGFQQGGDYQNGGFQQGGDSQDDTGFGASFGGDSSPYNTYGGYNPTYGGDSQDGKGFGASYGGFQPFNQQGGYDPTYGGSDTYPTYGGDSQDGKGFGTSDGGDSTPYDPTYGTGPGQDFSGPNYDSHSSGQDSSAYGGDAYDGSQNKHCSLSPHILKLTTVPNPDDQSTVICNQVIITYSDPVYPTRNPQKQIATENGYCIQDVSSGDKTCDSDMQFSDTKNSSITYTIYIRGDSDGTDKGIITGGTGKWYAAAGELYRTVVSAGFNYVLKFTTESCY